MVKLNPVYKVGNLLTCMPRIDDCHDRCKDPRWADRTLRTDAMNERHILYIRANQQSVRGRVAKSGNQPERKACDLNLRISCSRNTHVGKKLMKLSPNNWEAAMTMKIRTLRSLSANFRPSKMLQTVNIFTSGRYVATYESVSESLSASPASSASRTCAKCLSAGVSHLVLCGCQRRANFQALVNMLTDTGLGTHIIRK